MRREQEPRRKPAEQPSPAPKEPAKSPETREKLIKAEVTPVVARLIEAAFQTPGNATTPKLPFDKLQRASEQSRQAHWKDKGSFDEQNHAWNTKLWTWVEDKTTSDNPQREERVQALSSVGIDVTNASKDANGLYQTVETFRKTYLGEKEHGVEKFIEDLANGCKKDDDVVDLETLEKRLNAISDLFVIFGKKDDSNTLVLEHAISHGLLSQKGEKQLTILQQVDQLRTAPINEREQKRLALLGIETSGKTQEQILQRHTPEPQVEEPETEPDHPQGTEDYQDTENERLRGEIGRYVREIREAERKAMKIGKSRIKVKKSRSSSRRLYLYLTIMNIPETQVAQAMPELEEALKEHECLYIDFQRQGEGDKAKVVWDIAIPSQEDSSPDEE